MSQINIAVIGAGWIGEVRALTCARNGNVRNLWLAETNEARAREVASRLGAAGWVADHRELLDKDLDAVIISAAPESLHYPMTKEWLRAGKHVLLEKPMAETLAEADDLIEVARKAGVKFTIGYTQRYNPKFAYAKQSIADGTLGRPVAALVSRHITRSLGSKIAGRSDLGPVQMEGTHDIDLCLWWMEPARAVKVYAQAAQGVMRERFPKMPDSVWTLLTLDSGATCTIGSSWSLPDESPGFAGTSIELLGTDGALFVDESRRDLLLTTTRNGIWRPLSTMPGEQVSHVYAGPMEAETRHFIDCVALDEPVIVTPEQARHVMEVTLAADLSVARGVPVDLPLPGGEGGRKTG